MNALQALPIAALNVADSQKCYGSILQFCNATYNRQWPGGDAPTEDQQAVSKAIMKAYDTQAIATVTWHYTLCLAVLAFESANNIQFPGVGPGGLPLPKMMHPWLRDGEPHMPLGWTSTPEMVNGSPTGRLALSYAKPE